MSNDGSLFSRCLMIAQTRPNFDLKATFGAHELISSPRSLFDAGGDLLRVTGKSKFMSFLMNKRLAEQLNCDAMCLLPTQTTQKALVIDGLAFLYEVEKPTLSHNCSDFAASFCHKNSSHRSKLQRNPYRV